MPKRERYQELSILASVGDTSAKDLSELGQHLDQCPDCHDDYKEFTDVVFPQLTLPKNPASRAVRNSDSEPGIESLRSRFFEKAQAAGISFTSEALNPELPNQVGSDNPGHPSGIVRWGRQGAIAAALLLAAGAGGYRIAQMQNYSSLLKSKEPVTDVALPTQKALVTAPIAIQSRSDVQSNPDAVAKRVTELEQQLSDNVTELTAERSKSIALEAGGAELRDQIDRQKQLLDSAEKQLQASDQTVVDLRKQVESAQTRAGSNEAAWLLDEIKVKDLNDQLSQARETLGASHEVGTLMAERNLHIVDVYDTDAQGKTKPIFGRIFLVGNKQLLFYAYDLNESRLKDTKYTYRVWGEKLGPGQSAKALGAFYSDDPVERRWVFEYTDPKVLAQIDSIFVTFEPASKMSDHPSGPKLMYAYLRGDANHP